MGSRVRGIVSSASKGTGLIYRRRYCRPFTHTSHALDTPSHLHIPERTKQGHSYIPIAHSGVLFLFSFSPHCAPEQTTQTHNIFTLDTVGYPRPMLSRANVP